MKTCLSLVLFFGIIGCVAQPIAPPAQEFTERERVVLNLAELLTVRIVSLDTYGTGVLIAGKYILTCEHVIDNSDVPWIIFRDGEIVQGKVVRKDANIDLALIEVPERFCPVGVFNTKQWDYVVSVGHPRGVLWKHTKGQVLEIDGKNLFLIMETNFGASGSGVWDQNGRLVGIVQAFEKSMGITWCASPQSIRKFLRNE